MANLAPNCDGQVAENAVNYDALNAQPTVTVWRSTTLEFRAPCPTANNGAFELVVALQARFQFSGSLEDMAARIGAISATTGLRYWSVTEGRWRILISNAFAVHRGSQTAKRGDFSTQEVLAGSPLFFVQDDTRSTGLNPYSLQGRALSPDVLLVETYNLKKIRLFIATVFEAGDLYSSHYLRRLSTEQWGYVGLYAVRTGAPESNERSFINRAVALYRHVAGFQSDADPPVAP